MKLYHSTNQQLDEFYARMIVHLWKERVEAAGGTIESPQAPVQPPAIVVLTLPDDVHPESVVPDIDFVEVVSNE